MGLTACTEPQCLYKGALYLTSVLVQGVLFFLFMSGICNGILSAKNSFVACLLRALLEKRTAVLS